MAHAVSLRLPYRGCRDEVVGDRTMRKTAELEALMQEAGMAFLPGERARARSTHGCRWEAATVEAVILDPAPSSRVWYEIRFEGRAITHQVSAEDLRRTG
jgi:hypothetical protein